jgi:chemotaxis protein methyltransferase CheR
MSIVLERADVERFRSLVSLRLGLQFDEGRLDSLAEVLRERLEAHGVRRYDAYEALLAGGRREEVRTLAAQLTVGETYFFRYWDHFRAFADVVLPYRAQAGGGRRLRLLSAGCASGEEAYSLAILLRQNLPDPTSWDVKLLGVDINPTMVERARQARYSSWSLRDTPVDLKALYFRTEGREFQLDESVRAMVSFQERNLIEEDPRFWRQDAFDVVFCRNVLMYFSAETMVAMVARIARSLSPGGFLFLGHAETLRGISQDFHLRHTHETFYYQRRDATESASDQPAPSLGARPSKNPIAVALNLDDTSWVGAIGRASDRIAQLTSRGSPFSRPPGSVPKTASVELGPAMDLLRQERFAEAMDHLPTGAKSSAPNPDTQLLRAVLLTNSGQLAGAHYVMALCREHAGDPSAAMDHDKAATYLDAGFAMPHLHLGLLARRDGRFEEARAEIERALLLLRKEDPSRILLFGGGFSREALVDLCRSELRLSTEGGT